MDIQITVTVTVPDGIVNFMGLDKVGGALADNIGDSLDTLMESNPGMIEDYSVESPDAEDAESVSPARSQRPATKDTPASRQSATAARESRPERPQTSGGMSGGARPAAPKGQGTGKIGRPPTLHDHMASDGDVVRASGTRGIATLVGQGIKVYRVEGNRKIRIGADGEPLNGNSVVNSNGGRSAAPTVTIQDLEDAPVIPERPARTGKPFAVKSRNK
jgi:hypothetical protein